MLRWRLFDGLTLLTVLLLSSAVVAQSTLIEGLRPGVTQQLAEQISEQQSQAMASSPLDPEQ